MFDMWSTVTSKLEAHNSTMQTNAQTNNVNGQIQSSGSIKGKKTNSIQNCEFYVIHFLIYAKFLLCILSRMCDNAFKIAHILHMCSILLHCFQVFVKKIK